MMTWWAIAFFKASSEMKIQTLCTSQVKAHACQDHQRWQSCPPLQWLQWSPWSKEEPTVRQTTELKTTKTVSWHAETSQGGDPLRLNRCLAAQTLLRLLRLLRLSKLILCLSLEFMFDKTQMLRDQLLQPSRPKPCPWYQDCLPWRSAHASARCENHLWIICENRTMPRLANANNSISLDPNILGNQQNHQNKDKKQPKHEVKWTIWMPCCIPLPCRYEERLLFRLECGLSALVSKMPLKRCQVAAFLMSTDARTPNVYADTIVNPGIRFLWPMDSINEISHTSCANCMLRFPQSHFQGSHTMPNLASMIKAFVMTTSRASCRTAAKDLTECSRL